MFMTPNNEFDRIIKHSLGYTLLRSVLDPVDQLSTSTKRKEADLF
jgi:hypothetical protein